jgi:hypothetical protein
MFGIYNLLCDHYNLLFTGFALPGTVRKRRSSVSHQFEGTGKVKLNRTPTEDC